MGSHYQVDRGEGYVPGEAIREQGAGSREEDGAPSSLGGWEGQGLETPPCSLLPRDGKAEGRKDGRSQGSDD